MLKDDKDRMGYATGTDESILDKRLKSMVKEEVKYAKEYGDDYFKSGTGFFGRLGRSLGDSGEGLRAFTEMRKVNNQLGDMYTNEQLASMINKGYSDAGLEYKFVLPKKFKTDRVKKAHGGGDLPNKGLEALHKEEPELVERMGYENGGLLEDDREQFFLGGIKEKLRGMKKYDVNPDRRGGIFGLLDMLEENRQNYEEGGSIDNQMMMVMTPPMESEMESDDDMEDGYTQFIMEEALTEEEENMLMSKLEQMRTSYAI